MTAKRLTAKGEATRRRIVAAAAQLMYEQGITDTTLEDVRAATGASNSQIYHYFSDKQALLLAVIDYQTEAVLDLQTPHLDHLDTIDGLRAWRDLLVETRNDCNAAAAARSEPSAAKQRKPTPKPDSPSPPATYAGKTRSAPASRPCTATETWRATPTTWH